MNTSRLLLELLTFTFHQACYLGFACHKGFTVTEDRLTTRLGNISDQQHCERILVPNCIRVLMIHTRRICIRKNDNLVPYQPPIDNIPQSHSPLLTISSIRIRYSPLALSPAVSGYNVDVLNIKLYSMISAGSTACICHVVIINLLSINSDYGWPSMDNNCPPPL